MNLLATTIFFKAGTVWWNQYVPLGCSYIIVGVRNNGVAVHISVELNLLFLSYNLSRHGSLFFILESETIVFMTLIIWTLWFVCLPCECITMTFDTLPIGGHIRWWANSSSHQPIRWLIRWFYPLSLFLLAWISSEHSTVSLCFLWDNFAVLFGPLMAVPVRKLSLILLFCDSCLLFTCINQLNLFWNVQVCWLSQRAEALCKNPECLLYEQTSVEFGIKLTVIFSSSPFSPWWASSSFNLME